MTWPWMNCQEGSSILPFEIYNHQYNGHEEYRPLHWHHHDTDIHQNKEGLTVQSSHYEHWHLDKKKLACLKRNIENSSFTVNSTINNAINTTNHYAFSRPKQFFYKYRIGRDLDFVLQRTWTPEYEKTISHLTTFWARAFERHNDTKELSCNYHVHDKQT